ncbi:hypothetical protein V6U71_00935 [Sphingopyxis sp. J-6]|uniref:hypothetical protein n=1 Tax=Sphingopyxis sp. J-6 TaxID=3122054 RepID=UPI003983E66D
MKVPYLAVGAALLSVLACSVPSTAADPLVLNDIEWKAAPAKGKGEPHLQVSRRKSNSSVSIDGSRRELAGTEAALRGAAGPVSFTIVHAAGTLACTGVLKAAHDGAGRCRFTADPGFERDLASRGLAPEDRDDLLAMLLVDATIELADGLTAAGVKPKDDGDLIAAAALDVTPAYVRDLQSEAMTLTAIEDAIACKALDVDGAYVRGLAAAGYRKLSAHDVVGMKALGVSPEYARAMNRAASGSGK